MASIIRIKRSSVSGNPSTLAAGELAYSALTDNGSNGGDRLYIGIGSETAGNAANHYVIGGKYFTDMLDHTAGVLTASSALVVDSSKKLDELLVDNLSLNGSTVSSTGEIILASASGITLQTSEYIQGGSYGGNRLYLPTGGGATLQSGYEGGVTLRASTNNTDWVTVTLATTGSLSVPGTITTASNGNLTLSPNGTGKTVIVNPYIGDTSTTLAEYIYDTVGGAITAGTGISVTNSDAGNTSTISLASGVATAGTYGSSSAIPSITIDTYGRVTGITTNSISSSFTLGSTSISLGSTTTTIAGLTSVTSTTFVGALTGNASTATTLETARSINGVSFNGSADITVTAAASTLSGNTLASGVLTSSLTTVGTIGTGVWQGTTVAVGYGGTGTTNGSITGTGALTFTAAAGNNNVNLAPTGSGTVDVNSKRITNLADPTGAQDAATKAYVDAIQTGLDIKASVRAATTANITLSNTQTVDGVALSVGNRVLVKNQSTGSQNGIYTVASGSWVRSTDCDNTPGTEVTSGLFTFVEEGTVNADSGWVLTTDDPITIGTTALTFVQFSGAGQITAGSGLSKTGNTLDVNVANGIEISGDNVQLASTVAGAGLTYTTGVLDVVGTADRITANANSIDIASTYVGQTSITTLGTITSGTWNGTAIGNTYLANSAVTVNGTSISLGGSATITANTTNSVTFDTTGGAAAGATFNGSAAKTISYSTVGAAPAAGNSSITTVGTIGTGTWQGTTIATGYGGTGLTTYTTGDLIYASATNTLAKRAAGTDGQVLQMNSSGVPVWGDIDGGTY